MPVYKVSELSKYLGAKVLGEDIEVVGLNALPLAKENELSFVDGLKRLPQARSSRARALLAPPGFHQHLPDKTILEVTDVRVALAKISFLFRETTHPFQGISPQAIIHPSAKIEEGVTVFPYVYIGSNAYIGKDSTIYPFCYIGDFCEIGEGSILYPHVVLYPGTVIGRRCILHAGVVLGADGFGYAQERTPEGFKNIKIYHFGRTRLEDEVEVGANTTIDRATFGETTIGEGTKIDNLVQVGHNVRTGKECILVSHTAIGGSVTLGDFVMLGGQVGIAPGLTIGRGSRVAAKSGVADDVPEGAEVAGIPAIKASIWRRAVKLFEKLPELFKELKEGRDLIKR